MKVMIDSGTEGPKGHAEISIPMVTLPYTGNSSGGNAGKSKLEESRLRAYRLKYYASLVLKKPKLEKYYYGSNLAQDTACDRALEKAKISDTTN